jgi:UDP-N-acetylmuramate dehydrogenase
MIELHENFPLARLTTVRTGGAAERYGTPGTRAELRAALAWARDRGHPVQIVGSGSNLLVADAGVPGLVLHLERELSRIEARDGGLRCGGGARMPSAAARAAALGLSGIEFAVNIPGSIGGAVRLNANAYGGALASVLDWVEIVTADAIELREPEQLGFAYRRSALRAGEVVARAQFRLQAAPPEEVRATLASMRARRHEAQPKGIKTFGSTFKNPPDQTAGQLLAAAGVGELTVGDVRFSPKHANFVENMGAASTADIVALMEEGRRRVLARFGIALEREVQVLGDVQFDWEGGAG